MEITNIEDKRIIVNNDVMSIFFTSRKAAWKIIKEKSIHRVLYLSSVLYGFVNKDKENPFASIYSFSLSLDGPYNRDISNAILHLLKDEFLLDSDDGYRLPDRELNELQQLISSNERYQWVDTVVSILGIYGEERIYDFIFRDPEYQQVLQSGTSQGFNVSLTNQTVKYLESFRSQFEIALLENGSTNKSLTEKDYLKFYFEFIFGNILKRIF